MIRKKNPQHTEENKVNSSLPQGAPKDQPQRQPLLEIFYICVNMDFYNLVLHIWIGYNHTIYVIFITFLT